MIGLGWVTLSPKEDVGSSCRLSLRRDEEMSPLWAELHLRRMTVGSLGKEQLPAALGVGVALSSRRWYIGKIA